MDDRTNQTVEGRVRVIGSVPIDDVAVLTWPGEAAEADRLARSGVPRLLLVPAGVAPPPGDDPLQDWVRVPALERDVAARVLALVRRAGDIERPVLDADDRLLFRGAWTALSPIEARLASTLADHFGEVVSEEQLLRCGWPVDPALPAPPTNGALRVHISRLRRRIAVLGLEIRTVRGKGMVLLSSAGVRLPRGDASGRNAFASPLRSLTS